MLGVGACVWPSACGLCMCGWVAVGGGRGACVQFISDVCVVCLCVCVCMCVCASQTHCTIQTVFFNLWSARIPDSHGIPYIYTLSFSGSGLP